MKHTTLHILSLCTAACLLSLLSALSLKAQDTALQDYLRGSQAGVLLSGFNSDMNAPLGVNIRSYNSVRTSSQPLWVVDGMPIAPMLSSDRSLSDNLALLNPYEIESVQVLKDLSLTSAYGALGANGVIVVNTVRLRDEDGFTIKWNSGLSATLPEGSSPAYRTGLSHEHSVAFSYSKGRSLLNVSALFRDRSGAVKRSSATGGNFAVTYTTMVNPTFWFGSSTVFSIGSTSSPQALVDFGEQSLLSPMQEWGSMPGKDYEGYLLDYDNDASNYHILNSNYLTINLPAGFRLKAEMGLEYNDLARYQWYGLKTVQGLNANGRAEIALSSLLRFHIRPSINWERHFADHFLSLNASSTVLMDQSKKNIMAGEDFFSHELRAKGLNIHSSKNEIDYRSYAYNNLSASLQGSYSYKDIVKLNFNLSPSWTLRYRDSSPVLYYGVDAGVKVLPGLSLRAGYGVGGVESEMPYPDFGSYIQSYDRVPEDVSFYYEGLHSVLSKEWSAGADLSLLSGRLKAAATYFRKHSSDSFSAFCFGQKGSSYLWEWSSREDWFDSAVDFTISGIELSLSSLAVKSGKMEWSLGADFSWNGSVVTAVSEGEVFGKSLGSLGASPMVFIANVIGRSPGSLAGYRVGPGGYFEDLTSDGTITRADMTILGSTIPRFYGDFYTTLSFGALSFDMDLDWAAGFSKASLDDMYRHGEFYFNSSYVSKASYLRVSRLSASYLFSFRPEGFVKSLKLSLTARQSPYADCYASRGVHSLSYAAFPMSSSVALSGRLIF